ncbi:DUF1638 domain-containing protein [Sporomusa sphaeroides]|uniref:DUF1638 domain-containing protein n=1 Tax=Sporomusa sphaeroides TaxID=47679 RepID=UPI002C0AD3CD|nr:DUF1638 domain-containing protein [Sporomusa sphaeroides]HML32425.1 DUF1638 domain-containing protein [Sporomusa sphaeroides]
MDTVLISCDTLEAEVRKVSAVLPRPPRLIFTKAAWYDKPMDQRAALQQELDAVGPEVRRVLLAYGLHGGAIKDLVTHDFTLIVPRVDDCIPLFLGSREKFAEASCIPSFFLTAGWLKFSIIDGGLTWLRQLVTGPWPQTEFLTILPHSRVRGEEK